MANALTFKIGADTSNFKRAMDGVTAKMNTVKASAGKVSAALGSFGVALGGAAIAGYLQNITKEFARVQDLADRFRTSSTSIQKVGQAARQAGTDVEMVAKSMSKLTIEAQKGGDIADSMERLGISTRDFLNQDLEGKLVMLARAYQQTQGDVDKTAEFMEILGGRAQDLLPLLEQGGEALKKTFEDTKTASEEAVKAAADLDDRWTKAMDNMKVKTLDFLQVAGAIPKAIGQMSAGGISGNASSDSALRKAAEAEIDAEDQRNGGNQLGPGYQSRKRRIAQRLHEIAAREGNKITPENVAAIESKKLSEKAGRIGDKILGPGNPEGQRRQFEEMEKSAERFGQLLQKSSQLDFEALDTKNKILALEKERALMTKKQNGYSDEGLEAGNRIKEIDAETKQLKEEEAAHQKQIADETKRAADEAEREADAVERKARAIQDNKISNLENLAQRGPGKFSGSSAAAQRALKDLEKAEQAEAAGNVDRALSLRDRANRVSERLSGNMGARSISDERVREEAARRRSEGLPAMSEQSLRDQMREEARANAVRRLNEGEDSPKALTESEKRSQKFDEFFGDKSAQDKQEIAAKERAKERQAKASGGNDSLEASVAKCREFLKSIDEKLPQHSLS